MMGSSVRIESPEVQVAKQQEPEAKKSSNAFGRLWTWIKENHECIIISLVSAAAAAALITGLVFLTIAFPEVMVPIYIATGVLAAGGAALTAMLFGGFAVGGH